MGPSALLPQAFPLRETYILAGVSIPRTFSASLLLFSCQKMYHLGQETGWRWVSQGVGLSSLGMLGLESHSPTSSYGCQKQNNAKAHNPREGTPGPGWGVEKRRTRCLGGNEGHLGPERLHSFLLLFVHSVICLKTLTEHLLCTWHIF